MYINIYITYNMYRTSNMYNIYDMYITISKNNFKTHKLTSKIKKFKN